MKATELFSRVYEAITTDMPTAAAYKLLHETLVLTCHEGVSNTQQAYGNLFSQVDFLCKQLRIGVADKMAIQQMRRHSNHPDSLKRENLLYDARALCLLISAIFRTDIPGHLTGLIPTENQPRERGRRMNLRYIRCIVQRCDDNQIYVTTEQGTEEQQLSVGYSGYDELKGLLHEGMQLNLLDATLNQSERTITPGLIVVEPDFLVDISSIAACFQEYGHHPLLYTLNRMKPRANTQATLLGNFAGTALDEAVKSLPDKATLSTSLRKNFRTKALEFTTCTGFNGTKFKTDAATQVENINQAVRLLFTDNDTSRAILEPSFVCEQLGIQGRVDLMTTDMRLLVEQKSGRNMNIERQMANQYGSFQLEPHYVQLLLYYGVLRHNFSLGNNQVDIRLLYSKYQAAQGLMAVAYYQKLFREAIRFRNLLVAWELSMAQVGFDRIIDLLTPQTLNLNNCSNSFFQRYLLPELQQTTAPLHRLSPLERAYLAQMMTFIYREQRVAKMGAQEGVTGAVADLWQMPLSEKRETGNIFTSLYIINKVKSTADSGYDLITLSIPSQGDDFLPNFRRGDMVYLYAYSQGNEPDVRRSILFRGIITDIHTQRVTVFLNDAQSNPECLPTDKDIRYAIEHCASDASTNAAIRALYELITAPQQRRNLLLAQQQPRINTDLRLHRSYHPYYDNIILSAKQALDCYLIVGPPGTGKTSMALQYLVREELSDERSSILLTAYTNRAVDEICGMLVANNIDFVRLGNEYSCDLRFKPYLLDSMLDGSPQLADITRRLSNKAVVVGTTSMLMARPFVFNLKHFTLAIVDEASQILEPNIVGLLAAHRGGRCCIDKFILVGDHKQLPAVVQQNERQSAVDNPLLNAIGLNNCRNSLFERLHRQLHTTPLVGILRRQGRMHPLIADFPNRMFYAREQLLPVPLPHQEETSANHLYMERRLIFIPSEFCRQPDISDKVNTSEAQIVARLLSGIYLHYGQRFDAHTTVGVIVPYRNQIAMIRKEIEKTGIKELSQVSIDTVERYQGSQRDVIIYSFTVQYPYQLDFLTNNCFEEDGHIIDRKLNVAITRARQQMIITGNEQVLSANVLFRQLIQWMRSN